MRNRKLLFTRLYGGAATPTIHIIHACVAAFLIGTVVPVVVVTDGTIERRRARVVAPTGSTPTPVASREQHAYEK